MSECFNKTIWSSQLCCQNIVFGFSWHYWLKDMLVSSWHWCNLLKILSILRIEPLLSLPRRQIYQRPEIIFYYLRTGRGRWFKLGNSRFFQGKSHRLKGGKIQISSQSIKPNPRIRKLHNLKKKSPMLRFKFPLRMANWSAHKKSCEEKKGNVVGFTNCKAKALYFL